MPERFDVPPPKGVTPEPGVYPFGLDEDKRKALNFAPGLFSYTKLNRFAHPEKKIKPFVAGVGNLVSDVLLFGWDAIVGRYHFTAEQIQYAATKRTSSAEAKANKAWRDQFLADNPGVAIIRPQERAEAERLIEIALANPQIKDFLNADGFCETGVVADLDGIRFRSWLDKLMPKCVGDIKTSAAANEDAFLESMHKYSYDVQAGLYLDQCEAIGLGQLNFVWVVISKTTNRAWVQPLPALAYHTGRRWRRDMCQMYHRVSRLEDNLRSFTGDS